MCVPSIPEASLSQAWALGLFPVGNRKPQEGFDQGPDVITCVIKGDNSGSHAGPELR